MRLSLRGSSLPTSKFQIAPCKPSIYYFPTLINYVHFKQLNLYTTPQRPYMDGLREKKDHSTVYLLTSLFCVFIGLAIGKAVFVAKAIEEVSSPNVINLSIHQYQENSHSTSHKTNHLLLLFVVVAILIYCRWDPWDLRGEPTAEEEEEEEGSQIMKYKHIYYE